MNMIVVTLLSVMMNLNSGHVARNPVYADVTARSAEMQLPSPTLPDGASHDEAMKALEAIPNRRAPVDFMLRKSYVAPQVFRIEKLNPSKKGRRPSDSPLHAVDGWYVAYGDLEALAKRDDWGEGSMRDATFKVLEEEELRRRSIRIEDPNKCRFVHVSFPLLDKVRLNVTSEICASKTEDSILVAARTSPRFRGDGKYGNYWRRIESKRGDISGYGKPVPYEGGVGYWKITRIPGIEGALFIEFHIIFSEPAEWFGGTNQLRSKLPILLQSEIRNFRRELERM